MRCHNAHEIKFLLPDESKKLYQVILQDQRPHATRNKAIFLVAKYCALRASEVGGIRLSDYDIVKHCLYCRRRKGSNSNTIKIVDPDVIEVLDAYYVMRLKADCQSPYLFLSQKGTPIDRRTLDELIKRYGRQAKIDVSKRHFHVLKHTRAMELINYPRVQLRDVQWWLGHKSINNTMIYLKYTSRAQEQLFEEVAKIEGRGKFANEIAENLCNSDTNCI